MTFSPEIGTWLLFAIVSWLVCRGHFRRGCILAILGGLAAVPLLRMSFSPERTTLTAEFLSRNFVGVFFGACGGVITGSAVAAVMCQPMDRNRRYALFVFVLVGLFVALERRKSEIFYQFAPSGKDRWKGQVCIQTTDATCGPAALATCLHALGLGGKEADLAVESHTAQDGTLFSDLARAARSRGAQAIFEGNQNPSAVEVPAIASVTVKGEFDHFVALIEKDGKRVIADPSDGGHSMEQAKEYEWSGMFLTLKRGK